MMTPLWLALAGMGCGRPPPGNTGTPPAVAVDPEDDLSGLQGLPCGQGRQCATSQDTLGDTCCAFGDAIDHRFSWFNLEGVDVEVRDGVVSVCGGFGAGIAVDPERVADRGEMAEPGIGRCQRSAIGPLRDDGLRTLYFAHHGDGWVADPHLWAYQWSPDAGFTQLADLTEPDVLYEGLALTETHLFVASHASGLRSYSLDDAGVPTWVGELTAFDNAIKVAVADDLAYVIDEQDLKIVDVSDPAAPTLLDTVTLQGRPRDIEVQDDRVYVALGSDGLDVFDRVGEELVPVATVDLDGSTQAVAADGETVSVANWSHIAVLDADSLVVLATEKLVRHFEESLGVAQQGDGVFVAEWFGVHALRVRQGLVAPDIWVTDEFVAVAAEVPDSRKLQVSNRGPLNLLVGGVSVDDAAWQVSLPDDRLRPGESMVLDLTFTPPASADASELAIPSNDPDLIQNPLIVPLSTQSHSDLLDVGDKLTDAFGFLDPTGQGDLSNLEGQVTVLAYFALF